MLKRNKTAKMESIIGALLERYNEPDSKKVSKVASKKK